LMLALSSGSPESVASLLSHGAKVDPKAELFGSELEAALTMDSVAFLAAALQAGLRPAAPCRDRWTVEQVARLAGAKRCTEFLQASVGSGPGAADGPRVMPANTWDHPPAVAKMRAVTDPRDPEEWSFNAATVVVDVLIDEKGTPLFPRAVCPDCRLAQAAVRTVAGATFRPALVAGSPVMARARIPIQFLDRANFIFDSAAVDVIPSRCSDGNSRASWW